ncbi:hypothetical protein M3Y94_00881700 [Aphelenchoides besseyi]|nr:hypothetical protein M3Y94_00881700 [Aphelenchoides besseyi]KAI6216743.1 hypothetical protein M3Y95_01260200 [Aphelenchoides besseyi]
MLVTDSKRHFLDRRLRKTLDESFYVESQHSTLRFQIAEPEDEVALLDFICDVTRKTEPLDVATGISAEDLREWHKKEVRTWLSRPFTIIVSDCFEIVGAAAANVVKVDKKKKPCELLDDYTEVIANSKSPVESGKAMLAIIEEIESFTSNFLPVDCEQFFRIDLLSVKPEYQGNGIGVKLWKEMLRLAKAAHFTYATSTCTAIASTRIAQKFGMQIAFSIPYSKFIQDGKPAFGTKMHDGATEVNLMVGSLGELKDLLVEDQPQVINAYRLSKANRRLLSEVEVKRLNRKIRYEVAVLEDEEVIKDFLKNQYFRQTAPHRTFQCKKEDMDHMLVRLRREVIEQGWVVMAVDSDRLCGLSVNKVVPIKKEDRKPKSTKIPDDFTEQMDRQAVPDVAIKAIRAVCGWMDSITPQLVPEEYSEYVVFDMLTARLDYSGCRIGYNLWLETLKLTREKGYRYCQTICTAVASNKLALKLGFEPIVQFPYSRLAYKNKKLMKNECLYDSGKEMVLYVGDSEKMWQKVHAENTN